MIYDIATVFNKQAPPMAALYQMVLLINVLGGNSIYFSPTQMKGMSTKW